MTKNIQTAVSVLQRGGVIAYPTEYCFGLGCDPNNQAAVERILKIKRRAVEQGLILIASDLSQISEYADLDATPLREQILHSWPGAVTWTLPAQSQVPSWIVGQHSSIAMRLTAHTHSVAICDGFGHAIVSTSANRHAQAALLSAEQVDNEMGSEVDYIVYADVGGAQAASQIRDAMTGEILR